MKQNILQELDELKVKLETMIEPIRNKHAALFGGTFLTNLGKGDTLVSMTYRSITNSVVIPEKQLIVDTIGLMRDIFKDVDNIINLITYNIDYFRTKIQTLQEDNVSMKLNESRYEEYIKGLNKMIEDLKHDRDYLLKLSGGKIEGE